MSDDDQCQCDPCPNLARLQKAETEIDYWKGVDSTWASRVDEVKAERDEARQWAEKTVADVVAARVVTCIFCGHEYPEGTPAAQDAALAEHIGACEKHPLKKAEADRDEAIERAEKAERELDRVRVACRRPLQDVVDRLHEIGGPQPPGDEEAEEWAARVLVALEVLGPDARIDNSQQNLRTFALRDEDEGD